MPNIKAAKKSLRQAKKRTIKNRVHKEKIKTLFKKTLKSLEDKKTDEVKELVRQFQKTVDKAVKVGWLKPNAGNRKKSRLAAAVKKFLKQ